MRAIARSAKRSEPKGALAMCYDFDLHFLFPILRLRFGAMFPLWEQESMVGCLLTRVGFRKCIRSISFRVTFI